MGDRLGNRFAFKREEAKGVDFGRLVTNGQDLEASGENERIGDAGRRVMGNFTSVYSGFTIRCLMA